MKHILLTISPIFGATAVIAEPKAGKILQNGNVLHEKVISGRLVEIPTTEEK